MASFSGKPLPGVSWTRVSAGELELSGRQVAIVGGTGGIGQGLARLLAARGAEVTVVGRSFRDAGRARLSFLRADVESMHEAVRVGRALPAAQLDLVVMTTGIMTAPLREQTAEGLERDLAVSFLSRLAILRELAPRLGRERRTAAGKPRVFVMGFPGTETAGNLDDLNSEKSYAPMPAHMTTVAGNEALVLDAARRYAHLNVYGLNPGLIKTGIRGNFLGAGSLKHRLVEALIGLLMPSVERYAQRTVPLLVSADLEPHSGVHFNAKGVAIQPSTVMSRDYVDRFIAASEALLVRALAAPHSA